MVGYWPRSFFRVYGPAILTSRLAYLRIAHCAPRRKAIDLSVKICVGVTGHSLLRKIEPALQEQLWKRKSCNQETNVCSKIILSWFSLQSLNTHLTQVKLKKN